MMPFENLIREMRPLLSKYAGKYVPGFDREDVMQELLEVLYRTQIVYDSTRGSFLNLLIVSFDHRVEWLGRRGRTQVNPVTGVTCPECDTPQPSHRWGPGYRCASCGSRRLDVDRGTLRSLDVITDETRERRGGGRPWEPSQDEIGYDVVDALDLYHRMPTHRQQEIVAEIWA